MIALLAVMVMSGHAEALLIAAMLFALIAGFVVVMMVRPEADESSL